MSEVSCPYREEQVVGEPKAKERQPTYPQDHILHTSPLPYKLSLLLYDFRVRCLPVYRLPLSLSLRVEVKN